jgi:predicted anti-sigma-YlaC factor YlaD
MECDSVREAISARIDGEDPGLPGEEIEAHLAGCAACRGWQQRAHRVTRRARLGGSFLDHDLTPRVLAAVPPVPSGRRQQLVQRAGLIAVALAQLAITVPLLILGHDHDAGTHAAHELGSFDLALAIAFVVGAIRPALSAGLAWPCCIAAAGLTGTAIIDLIAGQTLGADEAQHLIAVAGAALLFWQARTVPAWITGPSLAAVDPQAGPSPGVAAQAIALRLDGSPESPDGGSDAARSTAPDTAARAPQAHPAAAVAAVDHSRSELGPCHDDAGLPRTGQDGGNQAVA